MLDPTKLLSQLETLPLQDLGWGTLQWLANDALFPGVEQTLGICRMKARGGNPLHYHPNCEELLYVQQGFGRHSFDGAWIDVKPGSLVRVPRGVHHNIVNDSDDEMICWLAFSSGDRKTVFLE